MTATVALYSKLYMERDDDTWCARPTASLVEHLHNGEGDDTARWIAVLGGVRVALGDPVDIYIDGGNPHSFAARAPVPCENRWNRNLYVPQWILESAGMTGEGEEIQIRFERCESLPKATKLGFKIMGDVPEGIDLRELLEGPLSSLGALETGQIIPAPVLDGVHLLVQTCEPEGGAVFLDGAEVELDLESDPPAEVEIPVAVLPRPVPIVEQPFGLGEMLSADILPAPPPMIRRGNCPPSAFVPFSGVGRRLCD